MRGVVVGVDAGGTQTIAAAARGDEPPRTVAGAGANANVCGAGAAAETIAAVIAQALHHDAPDAIAVGAAGAARAEIADAMTRALLARFPAARIAVTHDLQIALRAGVSQGDGMVLVAGTGSAAYAEIGTQSFRAGGGGYAFGDEGSGFAIGAAALRLLRRAIEGRAPHDRLTERLAERTAARTLDDLSRFAYGAESTVSAVASVAPEVIASAGDGERSAVKIVQTAALELFELVRALWRSAGAEGRALPLVWAGGLLRRNSLLTYLIETRVANELPDLAIVKGGAEPYMGALAQARALLRNGTA